MNIKKRTRWPFLILAVAALLSLIGTSAGATPALVSNTGFRDVPRGAWYEDALLKMQNYTPGIISGVEEPDGFTYFYPDEPVLRADFLKMAMMAAEGYTADRSRDDYWAGEYYTIAQENNILVADAYSGSDPIFPYSRAALEKPLTRYEAAVILANTCINMQMEPAVTVSDPASHILDYAAVEQYTPDVSRVPRGSYTRGVEQVCGKGILNCASDGAFHGEDTLRRCEAAIAIYCLMNWKGARQSNSWSTEPALPTQTRAIDPGKSFAFWLQNGHLNGSTPDAEARQRLFGDANKSYFRSAAEAAPYLTTVTVPIWAIDKTGTKFSTSGNLQVNRVVADEVQLIFQQIYNDPERYPIYAYSIGGARFRDAVRHSWGCAIDINPYYNCECNFRSGYQRVTCGYGWWPAGMEGNWVGRAASSYHGTLSEPSPYSIAPGGSVVRAFAAYGWGWGGSGTNDPNAAPKGWSSGNNFDFMHFSVLPSGG